MAFSLVSYSAHVLGQWQMPSTPSPPCTLREVGGETSAKAQYPLRGSCVSCWCSFPPVAFPCSTDSVAVHPINYDLDRRPSRDLPGREMWISSLARTLRSWTAASAANELSNIATITSAPWTSCRFAPICSVLQNDSVSRGSLGKFASQSIPMEIN